jgi:hypothetical protein
MLDCLEGWWIAANLDARCRCMKVTELTAPRTTARGKYRYILNMCSANMFVEKIHFKMEGFHTLKDLVQRARRLLNEGRHLGRLPGYPDPQGSQGFLPLPLRE